MSSTKTTELALRVGDTQKNKNIPGFTGEYKDINSNNINDSSIYEGLFNRVLIVNPENIFFRNNEKEVDEEKVMHFRAMVNLEKADLYVVTSSKKNLEDFRKIGLFGLNIVTTQDGVDYYKGKFIQKGPPMAEDWYDYQGRINLAKLKRLQKTYDNQFGKISREVSFILERLKEKRKIFILTLQNINEKTEKGSEKLKGNLEKKIGEVQDQIQVLNNLANDKSKSLEKTEEELKTAKKSIEKFSEFDQEIEKALNEMDNLDGILMETTGINDSILEYLENDESIDNLDTFGVGSAKIFEDLDNLVTNKFTSINSNLGTMTIIEKEFINNIETNNNKVKKGATYGWNWKMKLDGISTELNEELYYAMNEGKKIYFEFKIPENFKNECYVPWFVNGEEDDVFSISEVEMYNYQNITKDMFFLEDLIETNAPDPDDDFKFRIEKNGNFEKYKNSQKNQFMLTGSSEKGEDTSSFEIENIKNLDSGQYEFIYQTMFELNFGSDQRFVFDRDPDGAPYYIIPSLSKPTFIMKSHKTTSTFIGPTSDNVSKILTQEKSTLDIVCDAINDPNMCILPCNWNQNESACKPLEKSKLFSNQNMRKIKSIKKLLEEFLLRNEKGFENMADKKKRNLKNKLLNKMWKKYFDSDKYRNLDDFSERLHAMVLTAKQNQIKTNKNWWTNLLIGLGITGGVAGLAYYLHNLYNQDVDALKDNMNNNTNMTVCTKNAAVGENNFLKSGSLGYTYYKLTNPNICEYLPNTTTVKEHFEKDMKDIENAIDQREDVCNIFNRDEIAETYFPRSGAQGRSYYETFKRDPCHINFYNGTKSLQVNESNLDIEFNNVPVTGFGKNYSFLLKGNNTDKMEYLKSKEDKIGEETYKIIQKMPYNEEIQNKTVNKIIQKEYNTLWWEDMEPFEEIGKWKATKNESNDVIFEYNIPPNTSNVSNVSNVVYNRQWEFTLKEIYERLIMLMIHNTITQSHEKTREEGLLGFPSYYEPRKFFKLLYKYINPNTRRNNNKTITDFLGDKYLRLLRSDL